MHFCPQCGARNPKWFMDNYGRGFEMQVHCEGCGYEGWPNDVIGFLVFKETGRGAVHL